MAAVNYRLKNGTIILIDDEDLALVSGHGWYTLTGRSGVTYAICKENLLGQAESTLMHRLIMDAPRKYQVDHKNGDGLDNRKRNLRFCTQAQQVQNKKRTRRSTTGFKGVYRIPHLKQKPFYVRVCKAGVMYPLGYFADPVEAAHAYDAGAKKHFGEFARLNFPEEKP